MRLHVVKPCPQFTLKPWLQQRTNLKLPANMNLPLKQTRHCSSMGGSEDAPAQLCEPLSIAYYVTGHGLGHATRTIEVQPYSVAGLAKLEETGACEAHLRASSSWVWCCVAEAVPGMQVLFRWSTGHSSFRKIWLA